MALIIPSVIVAIVGSTTVELVSDVGAIPQGLPSPYLPHLSDLSVSLVSGALSVAALVLIQGAGVAESAPNPDGTRADTNRDFVAQGVGNLLSGLFRGQPVGGSVGQTALSVAAGARSRWAAIFAGLWMAIILIALSGLVGQVVMATLAAVLIAAADRVAAQGCVPGDPAHRPDLPGRPDLHPRGHPAAAGGRRRSGSAW